MGAVHAPDQHNRCIQSEVCQVTSARHWKLEKSLGGERESWVCVDRPWCGAGRRGCDE